ncbi:hypothetical protein [Hyalangium versicolor]|uniref:hypothetical protein n=1 Tax=Hyalangium versicolor TaxID=2861190 RepID=UPI001CCCDC53|nr:hypothetical protein [Hyalangium versicolor]
MSLRRWSRALPFAALALAGCKSNNPPASAAQDAGAPTAAVAPAKAPAAPPAPEPVPAPPPAAPAVATGPALSFLRPSDPERCDWVRQPLPSGEPTKVFSFDAACDRSMVSWSPDGKEGLVFTWPSGEGEVPKAWRVDLVAHSGKPLDLKTLPGGKDAGGQDQPALEQLGFDKEGVPVALISDAYVARKAEKGPGGKKFITFEGTRYPVGGGEGSAGLAHAYRLEAGGWKRIETVATSYGSDLSPGVLELKVNQRLLPVAKASPSHHNPGEEAAEPAVKKLDKAFPGLDESGQWMVLSTPGGKLYYRGTLGGEFLYPGAPIAWEQDGKLVELEGLFAKPNDYLDIVLQEGWLLVANYGDPRSAQVWDAKTKERIVSAEEASAPAFWPGPGGP